MRESDPQPTILLGLRLRKEPVKHRTQDRPKEMGAPLQSAGNYTCTKLVARIASWMCRSSRWAAKWGMSVRNAYRRQE